MSRKRFDKILRAIRYNRDKAPTHKDKFWHVKDLIDVWNKNMFDSFAVGWVCCLDKSMSPWTNKYTYPGHICLPRKPWPLGNKYHSICCCQSGTMFAVEIVKGKDRPKEKLPELYTDVTNSGTKMSLLLCLCETIFYSGTLVILDSVFCLQSNN